jgi:hypothetical protein
VRLGRLPALLLQIQGSEALLCSICRAAIGRKEHLVEREEDRLTDSRAAERFEMSGTCLSACWLRQPFQRRGVSLVHDADRVGG